MNDKARTDFRRSALLSSDRNLRRYGARVIFHIWLSPYEPLPLWRS